MRQTRLLWLCFALLLFSFTSCELQDDAEPNQSPEENLKYSTYTSITQEPRLATILTNVKTRTMRSANNSNNTGIGNLDIDTERFLKVLQPDNSFIYTFAIKGSNQNNNFRNLILKEVNGGFIAAILEYEPVQKLQVSSKFIGTIRRYNLEGKLLRVVTVIENQSTPPVISANGIDGNSTITESICMVYINDEWVCIPNGLPTENPGPGECLGGGTWTYIIEFMQVPCNENPDDGTYLPGGSGGSDPYNGSGGNDPYYGSGGSTGSDPDPISGGSPAPEDEFIGVIDPGVIKMPTPTMLDQLIYEKPFALYGDDIPCELVKQWVALAKFKVATAQRQKVEGIVTQNVYPSFSVDIPPTIGYLSKILDIDNAYSSVVNMDYFGVKVNTLPIINGQRATPQQFLNYIRLNINNFVDTGNSIFTPYNYYNVDDRALWASSNPLGAIVSIDIFGPRNGSVIVSNYTPSSWTFSTLKDPYNDVHPVSGNREFGFVANNDGSYTFYTKGVDRLSDAIITASQSAFGIPFNETDKLWTSFQDKIVAYVNDPVNGGKPNSATKNDLQQTHRPDWVEVKDVVDGKKPLNTLSNDCQ